MRFFTLSTFLNHHGEIADKTKPVYPRMDFLEGVQGEPFFGHKEWFPLPLSQIFLYHNAFTKQIMRLASAKPA